MAEYARRERLCRSRCAYSAKGGRACGRATEQFDVAQLRAGGHDRAHDVGGGHATRESRRCPLRTRRAKAAMGGAVISHLWAVTGVGPSLSELDPGRASGRAGPVRSSSANYTAKIPDGPESVYSFDTPSSGPLKSWLVVARGASA